MNSIDRLNELRLQATQLLADPDSAKAYSPSVLASMSNDDVKTLSLWQSMVRRIANELGESTEVCVANALQRQIIADIDDNVALYAAYLDDYRTAHYSAKQHANTWLSRHDGETFLLHDEVYIWKPSGHWLETEAIEDDDETGANVFKGLLVVRRRAFPDSVSLLRESKLQEWSEWQALWRYF